VGSYPLACSFWPVPPLWGRGTRLAILSMTRSNEGSMQARGEHQRMRLRSAFVQLHPRMKWIATRI
jgi:hypothetical protein